MHELSSRIRFRHMLMLAGFREALVDAGSGRARHTWRLGPVVSLENSFIKVTMVADLIGIAWLTSGRGPEGIAVTVVVVGHRTETGIRVAVTTSESDAWLHALLGREWTEHAYRLVETAQSSDSPPAATYRLFLDPQQNAIERPEGIIGGRYRLVNEPLGNAFGR